LTIVVFLPSSVCSKEPWAHFESKVKPLRKQEEKSAQEIGSLNLELRSERAKLTESNKQSEQESQQKQNRSS
jgi:hypothetical protein